MFSLASRSLSMLLHLMREVFPTRFAKTNAANYMGRSRSSIFTFRCTPCFDATLRNGTMWQVIARILQIQGLRMAMVSSYLTGYILADHHLWCAVPDGIYHDLALLLAALHPVGTRVVRKSVRSSIRSMSLHSCIADSHQWAGIFSRKMLNSTSDRRQLWPKPTVC